MGVSLSAEQQQTLQDSRDDFADFAVHYSLRDQSIFGFQPLEVIYQHGVGLEC